VVAGEDLQRHGRGPPSRPTATIAVLERAVEECAPVDPQPEVASARLTIAVANMAAARRRSIASTIGARRTRSQRTKI
jgi:hypothetical protein